MLDRKYLRRVGTYVLAVIACVLLALYIGYHLYKGTQREIETMPAVLDTYSLSSAFDAYIFRDETALGGAAGVAVPSVSDGEKITKGEKVASLYSSVSPELLNELELVREQQKIIDGKTGAASSSAAKDLREAILSLKSSVKNGELGAAPTLASKICALSARRDIANGDSATLSESLKAREQEILSSLGIAAGTVYAPVSGWYFSSCDGYEDIFTAKAALSLTPDTLDSLIATPAADSSQSGGRIVRTYKWYACVIMSSTDAARFTVSDTVKATAVGLDREFDLSVEAVTGSGDRYAVVFSCGEIPEGIDLGRRTELSLTMSEIVGFKIPRDAVRMVGGTTGVYVFEGSTVSLRKIHILAEYDDYYIAAPPDYFDETDDTPAETVTGETTEIADGDGSGRNDYFALKQNDMIVTKGKNLYHKKTIG